MRFLNKGKKTPGRENYVRKITVDSFLPGKNSVPELKNG
jgi:hypothetical protein